MFCPFIIFQTSERDSLNNPLWVQFTDPGSNKQYFFNVDSHETSWKNPFFYESDFSFSLHSSLDRGVSETLDKGDVFFISDSWKIKPARKQVEFDQNKFSYVEGKDSFYNIWYHRHTLNKFDSGVIIEPASTKCVPDVDSGYTLADSNQSAFTAHFCLWFAQGCCYKGEECNYRHRVPNSSDDMASDSMHDIFGRRRHSEHNADMAGVGSFLKECRGLYVSELLFDRSSPDCIAQLEGDLWRMFHLWGPIESIRIICSKSIAFIKYEYRSAAEFAKVACSNQPLGKSKAISIRWAFEDPNPSAVEAGKSYTKDQFFRIASRNISKMAENR